MTARIDITAHVTDDENVQDGLHAVRWASRIVRRELDYSKWHLAVNSDFTLCGLPIRLAVATMFPEEDEPDKADCKLCRHKQKRLRSKNE